MSAVDVVVPCYNYGRYLGDCVQSVLSQEGVDVRVLIIDDCSKDDTEQVGARLAAEDSRVEFRRHAVNRGHIATYNEGLLEWARAEYCLLLSADDLLTPGSLCRATRLMDSNTSVGFTHGHAFRAAGLVSGLGQIGEAYKRRVIDGADFVKESCEEGANIVATPTAVVRTALQQAVGGYRPSLPHAGDMEMWLRLAAHAPIGFVDAHQAIYRTHTQQMSVSFPGTRDIRQRAAAFKIFFREQGHRLADRETLSILAARSLGMNCFWMGSQRFDAGDVPAYRKLHVLALALSPEIASTGPWQRFRAKRVLGPRLWARIGPTLRRLRQRDQASSVECGVGPAVRLAV